MADETIVAVYDTAAHAEAAVSDLQAAGVPDSAISVQAGGATTGTTATAAPCRSRASGPACSAASRTTTRQSTTAACQSGSTVVTVGCPRRIVTKVMQILESHNPIDIDERANSYGLTQTTSRPASHATPRPQMPAPRHEPCRTR